MKSANGIVPPAASAVAAPKRSIPARSSATAAAVEAPAVAMPRMKLRRVDWVSLPVSGTVVGSMAAKLWPPARPVVNEG